MAEVVTTPASLVRTVATDLTRELRQRYGEAVREGRLFGSFARGDAHEESDVDVAVVLEEADFDTRRRVIDLATDVGMPTTCGCRPRSSIARPGTSGGHRSGGSSWTSNRRELSCDIGR